MTNRIAIALGILIFVALLLDAILTGGANLLFLAKKMAELLEWIAFWR